MDRDKAKEPDYTRKQVQVEERRSNLPVDEQEKALIELHSYINELESLLTPILTPDTGEVPTERSDEARRTQSPLADRLTENNDLVYSGQQKLRRIIARLEV